FRGVPMGNIDSRPVCATHERFATISLWIRILRIARPISSFSANCLALHPSRTGEVFTGAALRWLIPDPQTTNLGVRSIESLRGAPNPATKSDALRQANSPSSDAAVSVPGACPEKAPDCCEAFGTRVAPGGHAARKRAYASARIRSAPVA